MHAHTASREVSPIYERGPQDVHAMRGRKMSTGGNRSWSEEEEAFLLRTRSQKMPYKHIAAQLKKTELACRLHYHQLSHGSHRRKRSSSVSSSISNCSRGTTPSYYGSYEEHEYGMSESARGMSPISSINASPRSRNGSLCMPHPNLARAQKPLLPKPLHHPGMPMPPSEEAPMTALRAPISRRPSMSGPPPHHHPQQQPVDTERLRAIYEAHRAKFWADVASEYGSNVSAAQLEHVWREGGTAAPVLPPFQHGSSKPPTPGPSPDGGRARHPELPKLTTNTSFSQGHPPLVPHSSITPASSGSIQFHLPHYNHRSISAIEPSGRPMSAHASCGSMSASDYHRPNFQLPALAERSPLPADRRDGENMVRSASGGSNGGARATKISSLLTEDRNPRPHSNPRPHTESPKAMPTERSDVPMRDE